MPDGQEVIPCTCVIMPNPGATVTHTKTTTRQCSRECSEHHTFEPPCALAVRPAYIPGIDVQGRCPGCGWRSLFLAAGGYVTCRIAECPNPTAAADLLDEGHEVARLRAECERLDRLAYLRIRLPWRKR